MLTFRYDFTVRAPPSVVRAFHDDTRALTRLTPPPTIVQIHRVEPLADGSVSEFTLWLGPFPIRWVAVHSNVSPHGFTDSQARGPLRRWSHTHAFEADGDRTIVRERVEFEHHGGWRGVISRVLFSQPSLRALFGYRRLVTRRALER